MVYTAIDREFDIAHIKLWARICEKCGKVCMKYNDIETQSCGRVCLECAKACRIHEGLI